MQVPKKLPDTQMINTVPTAAPPGSSLQRKAEDALKAIATSPIAPGASAPTVGPLTAAAQSTTPSSAPRSLAASASLRATRPASASNAATVMNQHLSFEGNLRFTGTVTIDCEFRGSVTTDDTLVIGPAGRVNAEVAAGIIEISGKVHGNIRAKTRVKIHTGGEVYGNIETPTISMDEGVVFEGNCSRPSVAAPATRSASPNAELEKSFAAGN